MAEQIEIDIVANDKTSGVIQGIFQGIGQSLAHLALQLPGAIMDFGRDIIDQATEAQLALTDLQQTIESTGGVAGVTADAAVELADSLSKVTRFSDDTILAGENMLLTFTNIGSDIFPQATEALLDLATKMKSDLPNAAIQLGKALNDPIQGVTALRRVGVALSDEQEDQIKKFMEMGDVMSAQKVIIEELNKEFGGQAKAAGETFAGAMDILKNRIDNVKEAIGTALLPVLTDFIDRAIMPLLPLIEKMAKDFGDFISHIPEATAGIQPLIDSFVNGIMPVFQEFSNWWAIHGGAIIGKAAELWESLKSGISTLWNDYLRPFIEENLPKLQAWWEENGPRISELAKKFAEQLATDIPNALNVIIPLLSNLMDVILDLVTLALQVANGEWAGAWETIKDIVSDAWNAISEFVNDVASILVERLGFSAVNVKEVWASNWEQLTEIVDKAATLIEDRVNALVDSVSGAIQGMLTGAVASASGITNVLGGAIGGGGNVGGAVAGALFGGHHAWGGILQPGMSHVVGERRTELVTPLEPSYVNPNGGGGGINITLNYSPAVSLGNRQEAEQTLIPYILQGIRQAQANGLVSVG